MNDKDPSLFTKAFVFVTVPGVLAGAIAAGVPLAGSHHPADAAPPGAVYGVTVYDRVDPLHTDSTVDFSRVEIAETGSTAATMRWHLGPSD